LLRSTSLRLHEEWTREEASNAAGDAPGIGAPEHVAVPDGEEEVERFHYLGVAKEAS
jgi:hypothetical protein